MAKLSVAGLCKEVLEACDRHMTLDELFQICIASGIETTREKCLASLQSMASTQKCDRGPEPRTFIKLGGGRGAGEGRAPVEPGAERVRVPRGPKAAEHQTFPTDGVIAELTEKLGQPSSRPMDRLAHCFVLLGDWSADDIIARTVRVIQCQPKNWFTYQQGPNTVVGFTI